MVTRGTPAGGDAKTLLVAGDVMIGRGIDQILSHPGDPTLHETWAKSALRYVELAEDRAGPIPRGVQPSYDWGDLLPIFHQDAVAVRIVNLETAVTGRGAPWPAKAVLYRVHPANVGSITSAGIDVVTLANNHAMDWGEDGLVETWATLERAGVAMAGAGPDSERAWSPALAKGVLVLGVGLIDSGIPEEWAAGGRKPGIALLPDLSDDTVDRIGTIVAETGGAHIVVVSIHWGPNWGYQIPESHRRFARALIDRAGVHLVHGHSSHHVLGMEVHRGHLILYGCGDLITDYEGIAGHEAYRGDLGAVYLVSLSPGTGALTGLTLVPTTMRRFQLARPAPDDVAWLGAVLERESRGVRFEVGDGLVTMRI